MSPASCIENLTKIKAILEKGWCQGTYERDGACCIMGALNNANPFGSALRYPSRLALESIEHNLIGFNDTPGRTQGEVVGLIQKAIDNVKLAFELD